MESKERRRQFFVTRTMGIRMVEDDIRREQIKAESDDTRLRKEIQGVIIGLVEKGQSTKEIISTLIKNPEYGKYAKYFPSWVENCQRKRQVQKSNEDEERG